MRHIASVSFGKDSLAMLLLLLEKEWPLDEVVFFDTGMEFDAVYRIIDKVRPMLESRHISFTTLRPPMPFEQYMLSKPVKGRDGSSHYGYGWCGGTCRWGTSLKLQAMDKITNGNIKYLGIASDEKERIARHSNQNTILPLVQWSLTEKQCLDYCHSKGFYWLEGDVELYSILKRVSCWCCRNKNLFELLMYYKKLPKYFDRLCRLESAIGVPMKPPFDLHSRFDGSIVCEQLKLF